MGEANVPRDLRLYADFADGEVGFVVYEVVKVAIRDEAPQSDDGVVDECGFAIGDDGG